MRRLVVIAVALLLTMGISAQENGQMQKFSPEKFDAELHQFITTEAKLTPEESAKFFPIYKEMQAKMRVIFEKQRDLGKTTPTDEASCLKAIKERDENDLEMKRIQKAYHEKFLKQLPASKVYAIIQAEDKFHRRMLKRWSRGKNQQQQWGAQPLQGQHHHQRHPYYPPKPSGK